MKRRTNTRYSEAFKRQVVSEIEEGSHAGPYAAARAYGIGNGACVRSWLKNYGDPASFPQKVLIMNMKEQDETSALRKRVRDLERALADAHMSGLLSETYLEIACERIGEDLASFKKKHVTNLSNGAGKKGGG